MTTEQLTKEIKREHMKLGLAYATFNMEVRVAKDKLNCKRVLFNNFIDRITEEFNSE